MELKGILIYSRMKFEKVYDMPIEEDEVFQDITDYIMENKLGKEFFDIIGIVENEDDGYVSNDSNSIHSLVEDEIDEFQVSLGEHFPDVTFTIEEANDIYYNVQDIDEEVVIECLEHVISNYSQIPDFNFEDYYLVEASNDEELGQYVIDNYGGFECLSDEQMQSYFDYERFGRDIRLEGSAIDCDGKFLMGG